MDYRYPLNRIEEIGLNRKQFQKQESLDPRLYPNAGDIQKQVEYVGGGGTGLFSCSMLSKCSDEICSIVSNCPTIGSGCSQDTCNKLKKIVAELASCLPDCPAVSQEDRDWLNLQEWEWLIWDELNTPTRKFATTTPARFVVVSKGTANECSSDQQQNCEQYFGCVNYDPQVVSTDIQNPGFEEKVDIYGTHCPVINGLGFIDFRATRSKLMSLNPNPPTGIWGFLVDSENQLVEMMLIYPTEILGQRNLTGFKVQLKWDGDPDDCELQIGSIDLRFADVIYSQTMPKNQFVEVVAHDRDLSGNINSSASDSYFMFIRLKFNYNPTSLPAHCNITIPWFRVYAITTVAPPVPDYLNYSLFKENLVQVDGTYAQGVAFDGTPLSMGLVSGDVEHIPSNWDVDSTIPDKNKMFYVNSFVDEQGCGEIPPCGCCCENVRNSDCGYCVPYTLPQVFKDNSYENYTTTAVPDNGLSTGANLSDVNHFEFAVPMKLLTFDFSCLSQLP